MSESEQSPARVTNGDLRWRFSRFDTLTPRELQFIYMARQEVFVIEQQCAFLDADGVDEHARHLAAWASDRPQPLAYARLVEPGVKYEEASMGRVLTTAPARGRGLGRALVARALVCADETWPGAAMRISAQARLSSFYQGFGFATVGVPYLEDGIAHVEMLRAPGAP